MEGLNTLQEFNQAYERILNSNESKKEKQKAFEDLMTSLEEAYSIPLLRDSKWKNEHKNVVHMYRKISEQV